MSLHRRLVLAAFVAVPLAFAQPALPVEPVPKNRIVIQINEENVKKWNEVLVNIRNIQAELGPQNVAVALVAIGPGLGMLTAESLAAGGVQDSAGGPHADERIVAFTRAAVMVVWHLAQTRTAGARLVFGACAATIAAVAAMPVAAVERLARRVAPALTARFPSRTRFWLQFEGCATRPDAGSVDSLRRLGLQIQGAESARGQSLQRRHRRIVA